MMTRQPHECFSSTQSLTRKSIFRAFLIILLCSAFYILGSYKKSTSFTKPPFHDPHCPQLNLSKFQNLPPSLDFEPHHRIALPQTSLQFPFFEFCTKNFTDYCPCHDPARDKQFSEIQKFRRERHCPDGDEVKRCLIPRPDGYRTPFQWPKSRDFAWFKNVPFKKLSVFKKSQNWVKLEGDRFVFPGGGTSFPNGVKSYVNEIRRVVPLKSGTVRTVLDIGCGVASFGASLMDFNILTMSIAPRDEHEAQVQLALERGLPAMLGILSTYRLPFPSRSFDMSHCSRCLVNWTGFDGQHLMEIDRVLRPGGYWVLSGPPINWRNNYKGWERRARDLEEEQASLEDLASRLCWKKIADQGPIAVWRKPTNHVHCVQKLKVWKYPHFCPETDPDAGWYRKMDRCLTPLPEVRDVRDISGGALEKWPERLNSAPPRIRSEINERTTIRSFNEDNQMWSKRVSYYKRILKPLFVGKYRNIMDMNAGLGGFAASLTKYPVWVMNVVPFDAKTNTLGIIYERGLIGTYMNWCEPFSTYPRTYDLIHADGLFDMYKEKCDILDILFEIQRIIRPSGAILIRDHVDIIVKVRSITDRFRWKSRTLHSEHGPFHPEKILVIDNSDKV